jgi:hypothetical protein
MSSGNKFRCSHDGARPARLVPPLSQKARPYRAFWRHHHAKSATQTSREIRDPFTPNSRPLSSPSSQSSEHPTRSRSVFYNFNCFCLRRSTLTRRGTPLAPLETWRVASPTPRLNTKAGFINSMSYTNDHQPESPSEDLFGEIISSYTDAEALEDGFLAELHSGVMFRGVPDQPHDKSSFRRPEAVR